MEIGVKFCGNCQPHYDAALMLQALHEALPQHIIAPMIHIGRPDALLVLNGCASACAGLPAFDGPVVIVAPDSVDYRPVSGQKLFDAVVSRLSQMAEDLSGTDGK